MIRNQLQARIFIVFCISLPLLVVIYFLVKRMIMKPVTFVSASLKEIADGDANLSTTLPIRSSDEIGRLSENFNSVIKQFHQIIGKVVHVTDQVKDNIKTMNKAKNDTNTNTSQQLSVLKMVNSALDNMLQKSNEPAAGYLEELSEELRDSCAYLERSVGELL